MKVLLPIATEQIIQIIPRFESTNISFSIRDEETDITSTSAIVTTYSNGYMSIPFTFDFTNSEGKSYEITVETAGGDLIYRGKIFITVQTDLQNYKMNNDIIVI
jgi:hypothetical protein